MPLHSSPHPSRGSSVDPSLPRRPAPRHSGISGTEALEILRGRAPVRTEEEAPVDDTLDDFDKPIHHSRDRGEDDESVELGRRGEVPHAFPDEGDYLHLFRDYNDDEFHEQVELGRNSHDFSSTPPAPHRHQGATVASLVEDDEEEDTRPVAADFEDDVYGFSYVQAKLKQNPPKRSLNPPRPIPAKTPPLPSLPSSSRHPSSEASMIEQDIFLTESSDSDHLYDYPPPEPRRVKKKIKIPNPRIKQKEEAEKEPRKVVGRVIEKNRAVEARDDDEWEEPRTVAQPSRKRRRGRPRGTDRKVKDADSHDEDEADDPGRRKRRAAASARGRRQGRAEGKTLKQSLHASSSAPTIANSPPRPTPLIDINLRPKPKPRGNRTFRTRTYHSDDDDHGHHGDSETNGSSDEENVAAVTLKAYPKMKQKIGTSKPDPRMREKKQESLQKTSSWEMDVIIDRAVYLKDEEDG